MEGKTTATREEVLLTLLMIAAAVAIALCP